MSPKALLTWQNSPNDKINQLELYQNKVYQLGRNAACEVHIENEFVSNFHATLSYNDGSFYLTDRSKNGTWLGHRWMPRDRPISLVRNTVFRIGKTEFVFNYAETETHPELDEGPESEICPPWPTIHLSEDGPIIPERKDYQLTIACKVGIGESFNLVGPPGCGKSYLLNNDRRRMRRMVDYIPAKQRSGLLVVLVDYQALGDVPLDTTYFLRAMLNQLCQKLEGFVDPVQMDKVNQVIDKIYSYCLELSQFTPNIGHQVQLWLRSLRLVTDVLKFKLCLVLDNASQIIKALEIETFIHMGQQLADACDQPNNHLDALSFVLVTNQPFGVLVKEEELSVYQKEQLRPLGRLFNKVYRIGQLNSQEALALSRLALHEASIQLYGSTFGTDQFNENQVVIKLGQLRSYTFVEDEIVSLAGQLTKLSGNNPRLIKLAATPLLKLAQEQWETKAAFCKREPAQLARQVTIDSPLSIAVRHYLENLTKQEQNHLRFLAKTPLLPLKLQGGGTRLVDLKALEEVSKISKINSYLQYGLITTCNGRIFPLNPLLSPFLVAETPNLAIVPPKEVSRTSETFVPFSAEVILANSEAIEPKDVSDSLQHLSKTTSPENWRLRIVPEHYRVVITSQDEAGGLVEVPVNLPNMLWKLLMALASNTTRTHTYGQLATMIYQENTPDSRDSINRLATRLRDLVEPPQSDKGGSRRNRNDWIFIRSNRGVGYYIEASRVLT